MLYWSWCCILIKCFLLCMYSCVILVPVKISRPTDRKCRLTLLPAAASLICRCPSLDTFVVWPEVEFPSADVWFRCGVWFKSGLWGIVWNYLSCHCSFVRCLPVSGPDATSMVAMSINRRCHVNALEHASNCLTSIRVLYLSIANDDKIKACFTIFAFAT